MRKIWLIIQREYFSRVKKKSFILMTILGPILMAAILIIPIYLALKEKSVQKIQVVDGSGLFHENPIRSTGEIKVDLTDKSLQQATDELYKTDYAAIVWIPENVANGHGSTHVTFYYKKPVGIHVQSHIRSAIEETLIELKLVDNNIDKDMLENLQKSSRIKIATTKITESGKEEETNTAINMAIGIGSAVLIYLFIFLYGVQVMKGVIEEKTSRIVEVIISSVKPFQLMMGKILGIALVGLTQFLLWILLTSIFFTIASTTILKDVSTDLLKKERQTEEVMKKGADMQAMEEMQKNAVASPGAALDLMKEFNNLDLGDIFLCFLFYFLAGYLMYSALFAAVGAAADNETDTQQFMIPLTIPLIFAFGVAQMVVQDPESPIAFWFSIIPFTSPVVMMVRLPFGVEPWEIALSMSLLVLGFLFTTWLAGKIYRTGILMYGKKVTYRELGKWLFYKG